MKLDKTVKSSYLDNKLPEMNRKGAGWGFAALKGFTYADEQFGPVVLEQDSPFCLGAEVFSNNTGEITALIEALLYVRARVKTKDTIHAVYDSKYSCYSSLSDGGSS